MYQFGQENGKHFKTMKYLRQHYQKVHLAKDFVCDDCGKAFTLESQLRKHKKDVCGKVFACRECGWPYESLEALLTHGKRKGHNVKEVIMINKLVGKTNSKLKKDVPPTPAANNQQQEQQMESNKKMEDGKHSSFMLNEISGKVVFVFSYSVFLSILIFSSLTEINHMSAPNMLCSSQMSAGVQTDCFSDIPVQDAAISSALDEIHSLLRDIETQTEPFLSTANDNQSYLDQMLAQSSHMYTQTCDDFLSELCLADIQTQTHWPSPQRHVEDKLELTSTATSTNPNHCIHDELLVSTETQTSFTQCLLNSTNNYDELLVSTETQTMDPLLEGFDFGGGQASDFIDGFQSSYTQT